MKTFKIKKCTTKQHNGMCFNLTDTTKGSNHLLPLLSHVGLVVIKYSAGCVVLQNSHIIIMAEEQ